MTQEAKKLHDLLMQEGAYSLLGRLYRAQVRRARRAETRLAELLGIRVDELTWPEEKGESDDRNISGEG